MPASSAKASKNLESKMKVMAFDEKELSKEEGSQKTMMTTTTRPPATPGMNTTRGTKPRGGGAPSPKKQKDAMVPRSSSTVEVLLERAAQFGNSAKTQATELRTKALERGSTSLLCARELSDQARDRATELRKQMFQKGSGSFVQAREFTAQAFDRATELRNHVCQKGSTSFAQARELAEQSRGRATELCTQAFQKAGTSFAQAKVCAEQTRQKWSVMYHAQVEPALESLCGNWDFWFGVMVVPFLLLGVVVLLLPVLQVSTDVQDHAMVISTGSPITRTTVTTTTTTTSIEANAPADEAGATTKYPSKEQKDLMDRFGFARAALRNHRFDEASAALETMDSTQAEALLSGGKNSASGGLFSFASTGNFSRASLLADLGTTLVYSGRYAESINVLARSLAAGAGHNLAPRPSVLNAMGIAYRHVGDQKSALHAFQAASERAPGRFEIWSNIGVVHTEQGRFQQADDAFYQAAEAFHQAVGRTGRAAVDDTILLNNVKAFQNQVTGWVHFPEAQEASLELWYDEVEEDDAALDLHEE